MPPCPSILLNQWELMNSSFSPSMPGRFLAAWLCSSHGPTSGHKRTLLRRSSRQLRHKTRAPRHKSQPPFRTTQGCLLPLPPAWRCATRLPQPSPPARGAWSLGTSSTSWETGQSRVASHRGPTAKSRRTLPRTECLSVFWLSVLSSLTWGESQRAAVNVGPGILLSDPPANILTGFLSCLQLALTALFCGRLCYWFPPFPGTCGSFEALFPVGPWESNPKL